MDKGIFKTEPIEEPKKKRKLTEKQLQALQKGRAKMEEKRKLKLTKDAEKMMVKEDKKQLTEMRTKLKQQEKIVDKVNKNNNNNDDFTDQGIHNSDNFKNFKIKFNDMKNDLLDKIEDKEQFKTIKKYFNNYNLTNFKTVDEVKNKMRNDLINFDNIIKNNKK